MSQDQIAILFWLVFFLSFVNVYALLQILSYLNWKRKWRENKNV